MAQRIEHWPLDKLRPYEKNPRRHSDAQVAQIAASIQAFGFNSPVLVDTNAGVIAGHGRLLAAKKLGLSAVPIIVLDHLSETQKRAYVIADRRARRPRASPTGFIFVDIEVVQDNMEFTEGVGLYNIIHETQEVYRGPAVPDMGDDFAGGDFQSGQQRLRAMADIFVGPGTDFSCSQGQQRLGPVECLNAGFLIHA